MIIYRECLERKGKERKKRKQSIKTERKNGKKRP